MRILAQYHQKQIKNLTEHLIPELEIQNIISDLMIHVLSEKQKRILLKPTELVLENDSDQNVATYLTNFICNTSVTMDKFEKDLLATQHRIAKG